MLILYFQTVKHEFIFKNVKIMSICLYRGDNGCKSSLAVDRGLL